MNTKDMTELVSQMKEQFDPIMEGAKIGMQIAREKGLYKEVALCQFKYLNDLKEVGFSEAQAMQILVSHNVLQASGS